jgi:hypothetical protein
MKIVITESQLKYVLEQEQNDLCLQDELMDVNDFLGGIVNLGPEDVGGELENEDLLSQVADPKYKNILSKILQNISVMNPEQLRDTFKKIMSMRSLKEQQTPYLERTTDIAGVQVPTAGIHAVLGLVAIAVVTKLIKALGNMSGGGGNRRRRLSSRAVGCQGGAARARLQRMRRRRESWRRFLKKVGLR